MKKIILNGTSNDGERYVYRIKRDGLSQNDLFEFLTKFGFEYPDTYYLGEEGIKEVNEITWNHKNNEFDLDMVFFSREIEFIVRTNKTKKLIKLIEDNTEFIRFDKKEYNGLKKVLSKEKRRAQNLNKSLSN